MSLADLISAEGFYGSQLKQQREQSGKVGELAGHVFFEERHRLSTRILNKNVKYGPPGIAEYKQSIRRFAAFTPAHKTSSKRGQVLGHVLRVLDLSNLNSVLHVPVDLTFLWWELRSSGWPEDMYRSALDRAAGKSVLLRQVVRTTKVMMRRGSVGGVRADDGFP